MRLIGFEERLPQQHSDRMELRPADMCRSRPCDPPAFATDFKSTRTLFDQDYGFRVVGVVPCRLPCISECGPCKY